MARSTLRSLVRFSLPVRRRWGILDARAVFDQVEASGLSLRAFAMRAKLDVQRLYRWRAQLGERDSGTPSFVEIKPVAPASIEVVLLSAQLRRGSRANACSCTRFRATRQHSIRVALP
jgi:hypothetical protein